MKRAWVAAALPLVCPGCRWQPAPEPPAAACRVDLTRLLQMDPRWRYLQEMDARTRRSRSASHPAGPTGRRAPAAPAADSPRAPAGSQPVAGRAAAVLPAPLPPVPPPPPPAQRALPPSLEGMRELGRRAMREREQQLERHRQIRVLADRIRREELDSRDDRIGRSLAVDDLVREEQAVIRAYQPEITRLRLLRARLADMPPVPDPELKKRQAERLAQVEAELADLVARRDAEVEAVQAQIREGLDRELDWRRQASQKANRELDEELRRHQELALRTLAQEWQERVDAAAQALGEAPPGPVAPVPTSGLAPARAASVRTPAQFPRGVAPVRQPAHLRARRNQLRRLVRDELRQRVLAIARQHHLRPVFDGGGSSLPDRTAFFARQLASPGP